MAKKKGPPPNQKPPDQDWQTVADQYEADVLAGRILACQETVQACRRNFEDRRRKDSAERPWPYVYDPERGATVCRFLSRLKHVEGEMAGWYFNMHPAHVWAVMTAYSWLKPTGLRRFSRMHYEVARGNAKSFLSSGLCLYHLCADGEEGGQVYSAATTLKQAKTVWKVAKQMADKSPALKAFYGVQTWAHRIVVPRTASICEPICAKADTQDGLNISFCVVDEIHAHKTRDLYDVLVTALGKREQSMMLVITTAGFNRHGIGYELRSYAKQVLAGDIEDESLFAVIYCVEATDDWKDPAVLPKANPLWGFSVKPAKVLELQKVAIATPAAQANFKTKHCNVYVSAGTAFFSIEKLKEGANPDLKIEDFYGKRCWIGVDLASKRDIASVALVFKEGEKRIVFVRNYVNQQAVEDGGNTNYAAWAEAGYLLVNPGPVTDHTRIEQDVRDDLEHFEVAAIGFDPYTATLLAQRLQDYVEMVEVRQTVAGMSEPTKACDAAIRKGLFLYDGNPVLEWAFANVRCIEDKKACVFMFKEKPEMKIDPAVAVVIALSRADAELEDAEDSFNDFIGLKKAQAGTS